MLSENLGAEHYTQDQEEKVIAMAPLTRRTMLSAIGGGTAVAALGGCDQEPDPSPSGEDTLPRPTPAQLAWQDVELGIVFH